MLEGAMVMMQTIRRMACLALAAGVLAGCPQSGRELTEPKELAAAESAEVARVNYVFHLEVLRDQMKAVGDLRKQTWAERELENVVDAHDLKWQGLGEIVPPDRATLADADAALLVEYVVAARLKYLKAMDDLLSFYQSSQDRPNVERVETVLDVFNPIYTYMYYLSAEIPSADLRATEPILQATDLYDKAMKAYKDSKKPWVVGGTAQVKHVHAIRDFREVVEKYPKSNRISRCAFFIAEIYRKYKEYDRAVVWYDRAWQWDSRTPDPVRYRAATLYDFKLKNPIKALEYYKLAVELDRDRENINYARERIKDLGRE